MRPFGHRRPQFQFLSKFGGSYKWSLSLIVLSCDLLGASMTGMGSGIGQKSQAPAPTDDVARTHKNLLPRVAQNFFCQVVHTPGTKNTFW